MRRSAGARPASFDHVFRPPPTFSPPTLMFSADTDICEYTEIVMDLQHNGCGSAAFDPEENPMGCSSASTPPLSWSLKSRSTAAEILAGHEVGHIADDGLCRAETANRLTPNGSPRKILVRTQRG